MVATPLPFVVVEVAVELQPLSEYNAPRVAEKLTDWFATGAPDCCQLIVTAAQVPMSIDAFAAGLVTCN
jgi:hypothetical protein